MFNHRTKVTALSLLALAGVSTPRPARRAPSATKDVIVQMFEWTWDSVAAECTAFLGPAGYGYVQVSPPQEHIQGTQWWTDYQPVSYTLTSKRGNRTQFSNMITACHNAGVGVIVDTIFNHMTAGSGTGTAGTSYTKYVYTGTYQYQDFHHSCGTSDGSIQNYTNGTQVQFCELSGLADLATETEYVRGRLATYANDLISLGADGLRLDAAKHIPAADIANILSRLSKTVYVTQEVIYGSGEAIQPSMYTGNGDVQEFRYTSAIQSAFNGGTISSLSDIASRGWTASSGANVFVANHDTERGGSSLNYQASNNIYTLALVFSLSFPYGTPTVLSGYQFSSYDAGAPNSGAGTCSGNTGTNGWTCTHRWTGVAGFVGFFNNVKGTTLNNWVSGSSSQIAFGRGSSGYAIINAGSSSWSRTFTTPLPDGKYCNVYDGATASSGCTGTTITVSGGSFTATVSAYTALGIHTGALSGGTTTSSAGTSTTSKTTSTTTSAAATATAVSITFAETATTVYGENIFLVGSISQLGTWDPNSSIALSSVSYPVWTVTVSLPPNTSFQYKYIRKDSSGNVTWESDPNRTYTTGSSGSATENDSWR
ncbi:hypothetical protein FRC04_006765 [Tulasnella sp. 424]|nr:hypothetical protein FRC04_006765 [Tulasnella sp. 424]KAG8974316.1 hypothetical protein FRC05_007622 [Tulasnella sp. 425]